MTQFADGDVAVLRYLWFGRPFWALPARVVEDAAGLTCMWVAPGTPYRRPRRKLSMAEIAANDWALVEQPWFGNGTLMISRAGDPYSIWLFWNGDGTFACWYVNLELPWRRTRLGFDSRDHQLDLVVAPDGTWRWKDEDELREAVDVGLLTADEAAQTGVDGQRVLASLDDLLPTGFEEWRPDRSLTLPRLPEDWAAVG